MNKFSKIIFVGMVLSTNVQAQVIHNTTDSLDVTWNKVIDQLVDKGVDFTVDKQSGIIRSRTTKRMTYGESGASCSLTPKYIVAGKATPGFLESFAEDLTHSPVSRAVARGVKQPSPVELASRGDSAAVDYIINNPSQFPRHEFDSDWGKKYMQNNLNSKEYGVDFTTTPIPQTPTLSWGTRGKQQANRFRELKINYDVTILVRSVDGGSSIRVMEKYSGDAVQMIGASTKGFSPAVWYDFGVYTWNCVTSPSVLGLTF
jgi:hypothetical protein